MGNAFSLDLVTVDMDSPEPPVILFRTSHVSSCTALPCLSTLICVKFILWGIESYDHFNAFLYKLLLTILQNYCCTPKCTTANTQYNHDKMGYATIEIEKTSKIMIFFYALILIIRK